MNISEKIFCKNKTIQPQLLNNTSKINYDSHGAARYLIVVILWYFFGVASFIAWQIKRKKVSHDYKTDLFIGMEDQIKTKEILGEFNFRKFQQNLIIEFK